MSKRKVEKPFRRRYGLSAMEEERWDELVGEIQSGMQVRRAASDNSPYDYPDSFFKRMVYSYVRRQLSIHEGKYLKIIAEEAGRNRIQPSFGENPFHWTIAAIREEIGVTWLDRYKVSRFGRQLLYAHRHHIPVELLIGFLYQCGNPDQISQKVRLNQMEDWSIMFANKLRQYNIIL